MEFHCHANNVCSPNSSGWLKYVSSVYSQPWSITITGPSSSVKILMKHQIGTVVAIITLKLSYMLFLLESWKSTLLKVSLILMTPTGARAPCPQNRGACLKMKRLFICSALRVPVFLYKQLNQQGPNQHWADWFEFSECKHRENEGPLIKWRSEHIPQPPRKPVSAPK